jgi:anti-sigma factor RsiW
MRNDHLSAEELAAYLDGLMSPAERRQIEAHLIGCNWCLDEVVAVLRLLGPGTRDDGE